MDIYPPEVSQLGSWKFKPFQKERIVQIVFQPSFFRGELLNFGGVGDDLPTQLCGDYFINYHKDHY